MPYSQQLAVILEQLWQTSQESHFQTSVLVTLTKLAEVSVRVVCSDRRDAS